LKIRIKVKHLVIATLLIGAAVSLLQLVVIPKLQVRAAIQDYAAGAPGGKEAMLAAIDRATSSQRLELISEYMISYVEASPARGFDVYVGPSSVWSGSPQNENTRHWSWEEMLPYLLEYVADGPADSYRFRAATQLVQFYLSEGRSDQALSLLEQAEERGGTWRGKLMLERAKVYAQIGKSGEAMRLIERLEAEPASTDLDFSGSVVQFKAQLLVGQGKGEDAIQAVDRELKALEERIGQLKSELPDNEDFVPAKLEELKLLRMQLEKAMNGSGATVSGTVRRSDGKLLGRVGVFLRSERDVNHSIVDGEPYQIFTDAQGRYEFNNVIPGNYQLYLGLPFDQIDGWTWPAMNDDWIVVEDGDTLTENVTLRPLISIKEPVNEAKLTGATVKFSWEPIEGASYYALYGTIPIENGSTSSIIEDRIAQSEIALPVQSLYEAPSGFVSRDEDGRSVPDSATLLGFSNPELRYSWYVEAYDNDGRLIARSNGYRLNEATMGALPFFYLKERTLTAADRLMLDGRLDEGLAEYRRAYEADTQDRHSLYMITRIYGAQSAFNESAELRAESIAYLKALLKLVPGKKGVLFGLFDYYDSRKEWSEAEKYYEEYLKASGGITDGYTQSRYATSLMKQRRTEKALVQFREALKRDRTHRFVGHYLAAELYAGESLEKVAGLAADYPEIAPYDSHSPEWSRLVEAMAIEESEMKASYGQLLKGALEAYFDEDSQTLDAVGAPMLQAFVTALRNVN